jgi:hypothetical protein
MSRRLFQQIWNNKKAIAEGIKNAIFKKEDIEEVFTERMGICETCSSLNTDGSKCAVKGSQPCCGTCGCSLGFKLRALSAECPEGKWEAVLTQDEEDKVRASIK